ncbi:MAG: FeoB-associated Cys-rich membrane protein [Opitutaceae bacterium]
MSPEFQTLSALAIVAAAAVWLVLRSVSKSRRPGCGGDCGCPSGDLKAKVRGRDAAARMRS